MMSIDVFRWEVSRCKKWKLKAKILPIKVQQEVFVVKGLGSNLSDREGKNFCQNSFEAKIEAKTSKWDVLQIC